MAQYGPLDLLNGNKIDIDHALSEYNRKQYHHIFPNAYLKKRLFSRDEIFSVVNFCFLPADSNRKISQKAPSDYVFNLIPDSLRNNILISNLMPLKIDLYKNDKFYEFLKQRSDLILSKLDETISLSS